ncbi:MAG: bifunctional DNA-formamidopyrimidine glycosylase/DNA-(apurinic or apyrimidinic site) lyase [Pyrinomonadaceae bacterium]
MPELPEVETISRALDTLVQGRTIVRAKLVRPRLAPDTTPPKFASALGNARINFVHRRGKHILIDFHNRKTLIVHLRMSGRFSLLEPEDENPKYTHAIFHLDNDRRLVFDDQRHFGLMKIVRTADLVEANELKKLAPEPFSDDFSLDYLISVAKKTRRSLKEFLLDQTKVTGLGNIYASEAMFAAGLRPTKRANTLTRTSASRLYDSIRTVLEEAISYSDKIKIDPRNIEGSYFSANDNSGWFVYDREREPCRNCKTPIVRLKQGGRSTYFCRRCQRN